MEAETIIDDVRTFETRGGSVRYVVRAGDGKELTTFREAIGKKATELSEPYETLKPFKDRVAEDIKDGDEVNEE